MRRGILLVATLAGLALAPTALVQAADSPVPTKVQVPAGHKPFLLAHAVGVQIYTCTAASGTPKWQFVAPSADLYGENGKRIGTHYAGPTWETNDGSRVKGARVDGVTVDPTAIQWLLLKATPEAPGEDRLGETTYIQRLATVGGLEPAAADCQTGTVGSERRIPYTADYRFWKEQA